MSGLLQVFGRNSEFYYNPQITLVQVILEGIPNQFYAQGMPPYHHWQEIVKEFACEDLKVLTYLLRSSVAKQGVVKPSTS